MMIHPTDGLVSRLLQQQSRASKTPVPARESHQLSDKVNISSLAREQSNETLLKQGNTNTYGQKQEKLESHLIGLYAKHERYGSKA